MDQLDQYNRALKYAELSTTGMKLMQPLGSGTDGAVWRSSNDTAIKSFERMVGYFNERDSYLRLAEYGYVRTWPHGACLRRDHVHRRDWRAWIGRRRMYQDFA
jgi:hypothetical protein